MSPPWLKLGIQPAVLLCCIFHLSYYITRNTKRKETDESIQVQAEKLEGMLSWCCKL